MVAQTIESTEKKEEISPIEDLMREHGILHRILLIYDEVLKYLKYPKIKNAILINLVIFNTVTISQQFIENYHQELEEKYISPILVKIPILLT